MLHTEEMMFFGGGLMWLFWLTLFVVLIFAFKGFTGRNTDTTKQTTAMDALKLRYANGEIGDHEFEDMKKQLLK